MYLSVTERLSGRADKSVTELPVLRLGLMGFDPRQQALLETTLASVRTSLRWRVGTLAEADALCANGFRTRALPDGSVEIASAIQGQHPSRIDIDDSDRPLAFSLPLTAPGLAPATTFDLASSASTSAMLEKLEGWLRPLAVQFSLASRIVLERLDVSSTVFHVTVNGRLQAVVSRRNGVGVLPIADPAGLQSAVWARRPETADDIPSHFVRAGLGQVLWQYAMRTTRDLLSPSFRSGLIYWCRAPQLPQRLFEDSHLMIVRELAHAPATFSELALRTRLADAVLARSLMALCIVGAITNDKKRALRAASGLDCDPEPGAGWDDRTAPAPLLPQWT